MSEVLVGYVRAKKGPKSPYPWATWFDGRTRRLVRGVDFTCDTRSIEQIIRRNAGLAGFAVTIILENDGNVVIQPRVKNTKPLKDVPAKSRTLTPKKAVNRSGKRKIFPK